MKLKELYEGVEPKLPGAVKGIKVMSMDQFVAQSDDQPAEEVDEARGLAPVSPYVDLLTSLAWFAGMQTAKIAQDAIDNTASQELKTMQQQFIKPILNGMTLHDVVAAPNVYKNPKVAPIMMKFAYDILGYMEPRIKKFIRPELQSKWLGQINLLKDKYRAAVQFTSGQQGVTEATVLPAQQRELKGKELTDYFDRIRGTAKLDKAGTPALDKKGNAKYDSGKTKGDRYKLPYVHRSSVLSYYSEAGKQYDVDAIKAAVQQRPATLLKQNEKMKHSNGEFEQFFNIGFAALTGLALDENTGELIVVNTCPGAGSCKVDCFAMKGGKIQFAGPWLSDARILTFLLNDPEGFKAQLMREIKAEYDEGVAGDKKFPKGWAVTVRWHDAGDFFSPEYMDLAFDIAKAFPGVKFYAYTKMAGAALANKPSNFIINWSEGASTQQEKQVKAQDPALAQTKNSRIVPEKLFYDLLKKDAKGNLEKTAGGAWQPADPAALKELKTRLGKAYQLSPHSILSYDEWMSKPHGNGMKWNVIVAPGEGDVSANSHDVLSTLLLRH